MPGVCQSHTFLRMRVACLSACYLIRFMGPQPTTLMGVLIYIYGRQSEIILDIQTENGYFGITLCTTSSREENTAPSELDVLNQEPLR